MHTIRDLSFEIRSIASLLNPFRTFCISPNVFFQTTNLVVVVVVAAAAVCSMKKFHSTNDRTYHTKVSKVSQRGIESTKNDAKWQLDVVGWFVIWHAAWVDRFGQCFIPRKVDRAAPEARWCSAAPPAESSPWHPPVDSANSDSDRRRSPSRCSSRSHPRPPPCYSPAPLVAPFYSFSTSFADFETRFSPKFHNHTCVTMRWGTQDSMATLTIRPRTFVYFEI